MTRIGMNRKSAVVWTAAASDDSTAGIYQASGFRLPLADDVRSKR
jgi:hypothetical protein